MWRSNSYDFKRRTEDVASDLELHLFHDEVDELKRNPLSPKSKVIRKRLRQHALNDEKVWREVQSEIRKRKCCTHLLVGEIIDDILEKKVLDDLRKRSRISSRPAREASHRHITCALYPDKASHFSTLPTGIDEALLSQIRTVFTNSPLLASIAQRSKKALIKSEVSNKFFLPSNGNLHSPEGLEPYIYEIKKSSQVIRTSRNSKEQTRNVLSLIEKATMVLDRSPARSSSNLLKDLKSKKKQEISQYQSLLDMPLRTFLNNKLDTSASAQSSFPWDLYTDFKPRSSCIGRLSSDEMLVDFPEKSILYEESEEIE